LVPKTKLGGAEEKAQEEAKMKYRQEKVAENDWDGEFRTYEEWARLKTRTATPVQECHFPGWSRPTLHY
jgi:hypothetical protein